MSKLRNQIDSPDDPRNFEESITPEPCTYCKEPVDEFTAYVDTIDKTKFCDSECADKYYEI